MSKTIDIVFDGPPSHESGRFIEVDDDSGHSIGDVGEWIYRADGYWVLRMPDPRAQSAELAELRKDAERYRWLREEWANRKWKHVPIGNNHESDDITSEMEIDAAIDAAIKEQTNE